MIANFSLVESGHKRRTREVGPKPLFDLQQRPHAL